MEKVIEFIKKNYEPKDGSLSPMSSRGNGDDVFYDGSSFGRAHVLYQIAKLLEIDVPEIAEQEVE